MTPKLLEEALVRQPRMMGLVIVAMIQAFGSKARIWLVQSVSSCRWKGLNKSVKALP